MGNWGPSHINTQQSKKTALFNSWWAMRAFHQALKYKNISYLEMAEIEKLYIQLLSSPPHTHARTHAGRRHTHTHTQCMHTHDIRTHTHTCMHAHDTHTHTHAHDTHTTNKCFIKARFFMYMKKGIIWANRPRQRVIGCTDEAALQIKAAQCFHKQAALQIRFHCHSKQSAKQTHLKCVKCPPLGLRDMRAQLN